jgi:parallel beta-helix repeat protein
VVIDKPGMKLRGQSAILDGTSGTLDGRGIGILISGVADVEISGFTVRNFERGIVLRNASNTTLRGNEVHASNNKGASTAPPLAAGVDLFEGVVLFGSNNNQIIDNILRDNGHDGLMVTDGSRNNIIRGNRILNNGAQTVPGRFG